MTGVQTCALPISPTREECSVTRVSSNTPLQSLLLLNDPIYVEAARVFAQKILGSGAPALSDRIDWAFLRAVGRKPAAEERRTLAELYQKNLARYRASPSDAEQLIRVGDAPGIASANPAELAAMTVVARTILNLHETITRD